MTHLPDLRPSTGPDSLKNSWETERTVPPVLPHIEEKNYFLKFRKDSSRTSTEKIKSQ